MVNANPLQNGRMNWVSLFKDEIQNPKGNEGRNGFFLNKHFQKKRFCVLKQGKNIQVHTAGKRNWNTSKRNCDVLPWGEKKRQVVFLGNIAIDGGVILYDLALNVDSWDLVFHNNC